MNMTFRTAALATAFAVAVPAASLAATTTISSDIALRDLGYSFTEVLQPSPSSTAVNFLEFVFTATDAFSIDFFSIAGTVSGQDDSAVQDLEDVRFGFSSPFMDSFDVITSQGRSANGVGFLTGGTFSAGDVFSITVADGIVNPAGITVSFSTAALPMAPVPVPAAGGLLMLALAGFGVAARRRKAA